MNVSRAVAAILAEKAVVDMSLISPETRLDDLGIDSLGLVEAIFAIEETFDISVPFNSNQPDEGRFDLSTVASVVAAVERLIAEQK